MVCLLDTVPGTTTTLCQHYLPSKPPPGRSWARAWVEEAGDAIGPNANIGTCGRTESCPGSLMEEAVLPWGVWEWQTQLYPGGSDGRGSSVWEPKRKTVKAGPGQRSRLDRTGGLPSLKSAPAIRSAACLSAKPATDGSLRKQSFWLS